MSAAFIMESAPILSEAEIVKQVPGKAIFRNIIQSADEINQNKRLYPGDVLRQGMHDCRERMARKAFMGELDHPLPSGAAQFDQMRQCTVALEGVSHIIRDYEFRGNKLYGEMETTSTPKGQILLGLLRDHAGVGFSLRGMAELERTPTHNLVKGPLTIITFDAVSQPSHKSAVVDFSNMKFESAMLMEQAGMVCVNGRCFLPNYFDKLIESKMITFFERWV